MHQQKQKRKNKIGQGLIRVKIVILLIAIIVLVVFQQFLLVKDKRTRYRMGHDELTGIYNWEHLVQKAENLQKNDQSQYVVYSNITEFKLINELFGREKGNEILKKQANLIRKCAGEDSLYGRAGDDHFVILIDQDKFHEESLYACSRELQNTLADSIYNVRVNFGVYKADNHEESLASMCDKAILALDYVRGNAQETIVYYDDAMLDKAILWKKAVDEFGDALKHGEFQMYLQPQISAGTGDLYGAEALVRRIRPDGTVVPPIEFIPIYEKSGLISQMDQYIWEQSAKKLGEWKQQGKDMRISVNISPKDFYYIDICAMFQKLVEKYAISPGNLNIEITETAIMSDIPNLHDELKQLQDFGFTVEIDDFGSGYSSLKALKDIDVDVLKIDMGFLHETKNKEKSKIILNSVVRMAKEIGMPVITEGVETIEQVRMLTKMGCDTFQGYYFSKPISVEEFEKKYMNLPEIQPI